MKKLAIILLALSFTALVACGRGSEINGHNTKTAYRSVKGLKKYMPAEKQMEFEVSFWMLRDANKDDDKFLEVVDGKKPEDIIGLAKTLYQERKTAGFKEYDQYANWEEMIAKFGKERLDQDKIRKGREEEDFKNGKTDDGKKRPDSPVIYNPRSPQR
jgi:hypothetical protein